jgi:acyl-coenzyme A synthetase/AMP-(fatty) acid ligase
MILDRLAEHAKKIGNRTAFIYNKQKLTYRSFAQLTEQSRRYLAGLQLPAGSTAIILTQNFAQAWITLLALRSLGLTTICLFYRHDEIKPTNVSCVITTAAEYSPKIAQEHIVPGARLIVLPMSVFSLSSASRINSFAQSSQVANGHICLSTGTTGVPKQLLYSQANESSMSKAIQQHFGIGRDFIYNGLNRALYTASVYKNFLATWDAGGTVIMDQTQDPFMSCVTGKQHVSVPQAMLRERLRSNLHPVGNLDAQYRIGGSVYFDEVILAKGILSARIINSYGSTELALNPLSSLVETREDAIWLRPTGSHEVSIVDEAGSPVPHGTQGFLSFKMNAFDCREYLGDAVASARAFREGYFYPGDLAVQRSDSRVRILGRVSDAIAVKTAKFPVGPFERDLRDVLNARSVAVFSRRNLDSEDELYIAIVGGRSPSQSEIKSVFNDLGLFEKIYVRMFESFPTTPNGKVDRLALREMAFLHAITP